MEWYEFVIIALVISFVVGVVLFEIIKKKKRVNSCSCSCCSGNCKNCCSKSISKQNVK